jgi:hypothetical protein
MFDGICDIRRAGVTPDGRTQLDLRAADGSWDWNWFLGRQSISKEILAVALTAIASDKQVWCQMDNPAAAWSDVYRFVIAK